MELLKIVAAGVFFAVCLASLFRPLPRALAALTGALTLAWLFGPRPVLGALVPEALLVPAGLMVLAGYARRSGLASWAALKVAKAGRGRPLPILLLLGLLTFLAASFLGPVAAVALVLPVSLLMAVELDVPALPFVVTGSWSALWGGLSVLTAQSANLWLARVLDLGPAEWSAVAAPLALAALVLTLLLAVVLFKPVLRTTNERRARVLEYDEARSLEDRPLVVKTAVVLVLTAVGLVARTWWAVDPAVVVVTAATLLLILDQPRPLDQGLADLDGPQLLWWAGLFVVVGALGATGWPQALAALVPGQVWIAGPAAALLGSVLDFQAVVGAFIPLLEGWKGTGAPHLWAAVAFSAAAGAGVTTWGALSSAAALALAGRGFRAVAWADVVRAGLVLGAANLALVWLVLSFLKF